MSDTKAREVWDEMERVRGTYHPNDKDAYIEAFQRAIESAERRGRVAGLREAAGIYGYGAPLYKEADRIERGET